LVHWDQYGHKTDAKTSEYSANDKERDLRGCGLHCDADGEDQTGSNDTPFSAEDISNGCTGESTLGQGGERYNRPDSEMNQPKKVPADKIDTTRDSWEVVMA